MPPPMHSVARPFFASRFCISCSSVTSMRAPEAPIGWPIAIAPPLTLTLAGIPAQVLVHRQRLRGERLIGFDQVQVIDLPSGPRQHLAGGRDRAGPHHRRIDARRRETGDARQRRQAALLASSAVISIRAAAPSLMPDALPAVTVPSLVNAGPQPGHALERRIVREYTRRRHTDHVALAGLHRHRRDLVLEAARLCCAAEAFCCEANANASCCSRVIWYLVATFSAVLPMW